MDHVLFWDIDGTLLRTARAGVFALEEAARELYGTSPPIQDMPTAGLTDAQVAALVIEAAGGEASAERVGEFLRSYEGHLPDRLHMRRGGALPGVKEILEHLAPRADVHNLLLTGNTEAGARAKLRHYELDGFFERGGAFCVGPGEREAIAHAALVEARALVGDGLDPEHTFVIGDTPHDIRAGDAIGARTVVVAGSHSADDLREFGPWLLLDEFPPPERFAELLGI